jgi:hypothetical protein
MKTSFLILTLAAALTAPLLGAPNDPASRDEEKLALRNKVQLAIDKGLEFLKTQQKPDGSWSATDPNHPALTAMPLMAFQREPSGKYFKEQPEFIQKFLGGANHRLPPITQLLLDVSDTVVNYLPYFAVGFLSLAAAFYFCYRWLPGRRFMDGLSCVCPSSVASCGSPARPSLHAA